MLSEGAVVRVQLPRPNTPPMPAVIERVDPADGIDKPRYTVRFDNGDTATVTPDQLVA